MRQSIYKQKCECHGLHLQKTIQNILSNFIPHQTITTDDQNSPCFNTKIKSLLQEKNKNYKNFHKDCNNTQLLGKLAHLQSLEKFN